MMRLRSGRAPLLLIAIGSLGAWPASGRADAPPTGFVVRPVDAATGAPVADFSIQFARVVAGRAESWGAAMSGLPIVTEGWPTGAGGSTAPALVPGTYRIRARREAQDPAEADYESTTPPPEFEVTAGVVREVRLPLVRRTPTEAELRDRFGSLVEGIVVDDRGHPIPNVEVRVVDSWPVARSDGTIDDRHLRGGRAATGPDGRYRLRFGGGWSAPGGNGTGPTPQLIITCPGRVELARTPPTPVEASTVVRVWPPCSRPPVRVDFRLVEPAVVTLEFEGGNARRLEALVDQTPASPAAVRIDRPTRDAPVRWAVAPTLPWRFRVGNSEDGFAGGGSLMGDSLVSPRVVFPRPGAYELKLRLVLTYPDIHSVSARFEVLRVRGPGGENLMAQVLPDAPP